MIGHKEEFHSDALKGKRWFGVEEQERELSDEEKMSILQNLLRSAERIAQELKDNYQYNRKHHGGEER